jgi:hypothetical protein
MKNKFKKSKIIVPALALITTTTAASVTGTVAWFSANRAATVTASQFQATDSEGNLQVLAKKGVGTTSTATTAGTTSAVTVDGLLTHGSYNAAGSGKTTGELYVANISEHTSTGDSDTATYEVTGYTSMGDISGNTGTTITPSSYPWMAGQTADSTPKKIWYAVSWTIDISLASEGNELATKMVFVNFNKTTFENSADVNQGFRVALMDGAHTYIIGNDGQTNHVTGTTTSDVAAWKPYHQFAENYTAVQDNASKSASEVVGNGFLFELSGTTAKTVTCVAWYEGEDTNVVSSTSNTFVASSLELSFYCRQTTKA